MEFKLESRHQQVREAVRKFAEQEVLPLLPGDDELATYNPFLLQRLKESGLLGLCVPEKYGGGGNDYISLAIACEELGRVDMASCFTLSVHLALSSLALLQWGTEEQKLAYLIPQAKGLKTGAFAFTEVESGSDFWRMRTFAEPKGRGYIVDGVKMWVSLIDIADNFLVFASTGLQKKHRGITCFLIERGTLGVEATSTYGKMNMRLSNAGKLVLHNVYVPLENMIGKEGEGVKIALSAIDNARFTDAAGAIGLTQACLDTSIDYARKREIKGQPLGKYQLVQEMIANMVLGLEASRLLVYKIGWMKNEGLRCTKETALAKWYASEVAFKAAADTMQILGGSSYLPSSPVERYLRNAKGAEIYTGAREILKIITAEYALGYRKDKHLRKNLPPWPFKEQEES